VTSAARSPLGRLIRCRASDNLELEGFIADVTKASSSSVAIIHIHGMFENFHMPLFIDPLMAELQRRQHAMLTVNTRAQDYSYYHRLWSENSFRWQRNGGSYEVFANCLKDLDGWVSFCRAEIDTPRIFLSGHSHGALKVAYYAAKRANVSVDGVIMISPSDDVGIQERALGNRYGEAVELAKTWIEDGRGKEIVPDWMYGSPISAETYLDMFNADSELALFRFGNPELSNGIASLVCVPSLVIFGENDIATAGLSSVDAVAVCESLLSGLPSFEGIVIRGADHQYKNREYELVGRIVEWVTARSVDRS
jgi:pimeloyl-ACP methyl ester carboxylesterase